MIRNNQTYYYHADGLGSIIAITDSTGNVVQRYEYNNFGEITYQQDPNFKQPYSYTGREYDQESGLYYYRARYYDPKIGRFITEDPIGFSGGINFYSYVENNPINFTDPSGLSSKCCNGEWRGAASRYINVWCKCYWLCVPPGGVIWSGNWFAQPSTNGQLINAGGGKGTKRGDACLCKDPDGGGHIVPLSLSR